MLASCLVCHNKDEDESRQREQDGKEQQNSQCGEALQALCIMVSVPQLAKAYGANIPVERSASAMLSTWQRGPGRIHSRLHRCSRGPGPPTDSSAARSIASRFQASRLGRNARGAFA